MRTVLLIDDDAFFRMVMSSILAQEGFAVLTAGDGEEGVAIFGRELPDIVLMDALMPGMDGFEATRRIKALAGAEQFVPIIFLTSLEDEQLLARCLHCGGDDFLSKPVSRTLLQARLGAWIRRLELMEKVTHDRHAVEEVILKMRQSEGFAPDRLTVLVTGMERTTGDFVFSAFRPDGVQHVMLGDFTGHGLPAAVGGPMVSDVFYSMTAKDYPLADILIEINDKMCRKTPLSMWLAAAFIERSQEELTVINAGLPDLLLFQEGAWRESFPSALMPLGIKLKLDVAGARQRRALAGGERLIVASDGIVETRSPDGEMFGGERLRHALGRLLGAGRPLNELLAELDAYRGASEPQDDITMVEILC